MSHTSESPSLPVSPQVLPDNLRDELDQHILATQGLMVDAISNESNSTPASDSTLGGLLQNVVSGARKLLHRAHKRDVLLDLGFGGATTTQLFEQHPQLRDVIRAACKEGKFGHIVDLQMLQIPGTPAGIYSMQDRGRDLSSSFDRPYVGKAVDGFFEYLSSNNEQFSATDRPYYAKFCSIVQSSGTGKSRLLTELRKKGVITLYMNIREDDVGFPARDDFPSKILTENLQSEAEYTTRCCAFFAAVFATLDEVLKDRLDDPAIARWTDEMCDMGSQSPCRTEFFTKVESKYPIIYSQMMATDQSKQVETGENAETSRPAKKRKADSDTGDSCETAASASTENPRLRGGLLLRSIYGNMLHTLQRRFTPGNHPKLVIGIDEAHSLSQKTEKFRPSHILCRVINMYSRTGTESIWVAFASTTSRVADFSAPQQIHDSLRVAASGLLLYPPYTDLGWDQNADGITNIPANEIASFQHIAGFGRPLWKSLTSVAGEGVASILTVASQKLLSSLKLNMNQKRALVLLSQRFALDVCFGHPDAVSYVEKEVASHLRVCYATVKDRTWSFTGYPSEPLVSCAAANLLHKDKDNLSMALEALEEKVEEGLFEIGQSGELTSRLVLLLAKDSYVRRDNPKYPYTRIPGGDRDWGYELIDCQSVSITAFLEYLFGKSFWEQAGDTAKESFRRAYINFSHWVPMDELISPKSGDENDCSAAEWTLRHWHRTSAVQCCHHQPSVDKMIPIFFDDPKLPSDMDRVSQMFVSDKAGQRSHETDTGFISRTDKSIKCQSPLPFIALLLDLNGETKLKVTFEQKPNTGSQLRSQSSTDQCLRIYASGVSRETFPFLQSHVAELLKGLISKPKEPKSDARHGLQARVKYGRSVKGSHMRWEEQDVE